MNNRTVGMCANKVQWKLLSDLLDAAPCCGRFVLMSEWSLRMGSVCFLYLVGIANTGINMDRSEREPMQGLVRLSLKTLCPFLDTLLQIIGLCNNEIIG